MTITNKLIEMPRHPHQVYILMGPSGSGKTTIAQALRKYGVHEHVSCTTRAPRNNETNGIQYYFMTREMFNRQDMLECAEHSGNLYGVTETEFLHNLGKYKASVIVTEIQGAIQIKQAFPECTTLIFVNASRDEVVERMKERGDSLDSIMKRLQYDDERDVWNNWIHADYTVDNSDGATIDKIVEDVLFIMGIEPKELTKAS